MNRARLAGGDGDQQAHGKDKPEELPLPWPSRAALAGIDFQPQVTGDPALEAFQHPIRSRLTPDVDIAVVGITGEAQAALLQLFVQRIKVDVRQEGRERPWGVPSVPLAVTPSGITTPARRKRPMIRSTLLSLTTSPILCIRMS